MELKTLANVIFIEGEGLHSGKMCKLMIEPSFKEGIYFKNDLGAEIVSHETLDGSELGTNFVFLNNGERVLTVEHLLSTIYLKGITSAIISVYGGEVPILDGSGQCFSEAIDRAGVVGDLGFCLRRTVNDYVEFRGADEYIKMTPRDDCKISINLRIDFENECVSNMPQSVNFILGSDISSVVSARTFGFKSDIDQLLSKGLCLGGSMSNAILIDTHSVLNPQGLRFENELVSHKLLDLIGDLSPLFYNYLGFDIECYKPGHRINNAFLRSLF